MYHLYGSIILKTIDPYFRKYLVSKNSPFINTVMVRGGPLIGILLVGIFFYNEKYNWKQIVGIFMTIFGIYLLISK